METVFFFYNIIITLAYVFCSVSFFALFNRSRDKRLKWLAIVFFLFVIDNLHFFMNEFLPSFSGFYAAMIERAPVLGVTCSFLICLSYRRTFLAYIDKKSTALETAVWIVAALLIAVSMAFYNTVLGRILDFLVLNAAALGVYVTALNHIGGRGALSGGGGAPDIPAWFLWTGAVFEFLCVVEQVIEMNGIRFIPPRYVSIELLGAVFAIAALASIFREFGRLIEGEAPEAPAETAPAPGRELNLTEFGRAKGLTSRELDILEYLVRGCSVAQICDEAHIAQGTVKTHTHNIYQKVEVKNRIQLLTCINDFQYGSK